MQFVEVFDRPILELLRNLDAGEIRINLPFEFLNLNRFLGTPGAFVSGAMIIRVVAKQWVCDFGYWRLACLSQTTG